MVASRYQISPGNDNDNLAVPWRCVYVTNPDDLSRFPKNATEIPNQQVTFVSEYRLD